MPLFFHLARSPRVRPDTKNTPGLVYARAQVCKSVCRRVSCLQSARVHIALGFECILVYPHRSACMQLVGYDVLRIFI